MAVVIILAGVPVYRLTRPATAEVAVNPSARDASPDAQAGTPAPLEVEAVFAPAPTDFQIKNLDQTVLVGQGPHARFHTRWTVLVPPEGLDLVIQAHWSASAAATDAASDPAGSANPAAARVALLFADGRQVEKTFWAGANGTLTEVFTVPGDNAAATH